MGRCERKNLRWHAPKRQPSLDAQKYNYPRLDDEEILRQKNSFHLILSFSSIHSIVVDPV